MKKTFNLLAVLAAMTMSACSSDEPQPVSATEDYNREFVKEFGVPAAGHDFSMATTAGLKVKSAQGDYVTVTAEIDGTEYLFADCHVPAGITALPVTIPRNVSELKITTATGERTIAANALVDLDEIKTDEQIVLLDNEQSHPIVAIKQQDFMNALLNFDVNGKKFESYNYDTFKKRYFTGYIFPIYWRKDADGQKDYQVMFSQSNSAQNSDVKSTPIIFSNDQSAENPFPDLRYSPWVSEVQDIPDNYESDNRFYGGTTYEINAFPFNSNSNYLIVSRGVKVDDYPNLGSQYSSNWYLELWRGLDNENGPSIVSESPYRNIALWNGNYFDVPLKNINAAYYASYPIPVSLKNKVYISDDALVEGTEYGHFRLISSGSAYIIGFSDAPKLPASNQIRDFCDVAFLYIRLSGYSGGSISTPKVYSWAIAAEDLGGSDDWDFNDVVFTFSDQIRDLNTVSVKTNADATRIGPRDAEPVRVLSVTPKAAGGTMPLYITYTGKVAKKPVLPNGEGESAEIMYSVANQAVKEYMSTLEYPEATYVVGKEIHAWLGADNYKTMINTGEKLQNISAPAVSFAIPIDEILGVGYDSSIGDFNTGSSMASIANKTMCGFAVIVDKNDILGIDAINEEEEGMRRAENLVLGQDMYLIGSPDNSKGEVAPQMILVPFSYWRWPQERVKINEAYPDFTGWLSDPNSNPTWYYNYIKEKVTF